MTAVPPPILLCCAVVEGGVETSAGGNIDQENKCVDGENLVICWKT